LFIGPSPRPSVFLDGGKGEKPERERERESWSREGREAIRDP